MRGAFENLFAFLLGYAAENPEDFPFLLQAPVISEAMKDLLLRFIADGTGVIEDQIGLLDVLDLAVALRNERADDLLGVVHVHLTAEGFEVELFGRFRGHPGPSITQRHPGPASQQGPLAV